MTRFIRYLNELELSQKEKINFRDLLEDFIKKLEKYTKNKPKALTADGKNSRVDSFYFFSNGDYFFNVRRNRRNLIMQIIYAMRRFTQYILIIFLFNF